MAEVLLSPGVLSIENDQSQVTQGPVTVGAAIIGPTVKGPVEIPTLVTSYSDYVNKFGTTFVSGGDVYSYFTSMTAYNYFNNGGESLLVSRIVSGTYSSATSSFVSGSTTGSLASGSSVVFETISKGAIMNSADVLVAGLPVSTGTSDNIKYEIVAPDTSSGTFGLLIRQGNDTDNSKIVLETWTGLSLDPKSPNFISRVIGDYTLNYNPTNVQIEISGSYPNASRYIRVKSVITTPDYLDNNGAAKAQYTPFIPVAQTGVFGGAVGAMETAANNKYFEAITNANSQGAVAGNYTNMINLLSNQDDYRFNILLTPGLVNGFSNHTSAISSIITNTQGRGDSLYVLDLVGYGSSVTTVTGQAASRDNSYAASYWPWCQIQDPSSGKNVWVPASVLIAGVYAYNDRVAEPWFAPAGINRGGLGTVIRAEQKLSQAQRDTLYQGKVNPIATFPGTGTVVYGNKTLQTKASALDRVNVRRLLISLKGYIGQVANTLVFEQNTVATRNQFLAQVNPYLESVQQRQGLYAFRVVMDDSNNTPDVIDRNQLVGAIYLQPTKTAEYIYLNFNITPTGASFA
jgi:phage tail sheath protein FI